MGDTDDDAAPYRLEPSDDKPGSWTVTGPNGLVGVYPNAGEAQARADYLNEQIAEEREDDS